MAEDGFFWIYLVFFMIPLARIIPRLVRKWQNKGKFSTKTPNFQNISQEGFEKMSNVENLKTFEKTASFETPLKKPLEKDMEVLDEINNGTKDFDQIQKNCKINNKELEKILKKFEDDGLMRVIKKEGVRGSKIELHPTEKGFKKFNEQ